MKTIGFRGTLFSDKPIWQQSWASENDATWKGFETAFQVLPCPEDYFFWCFPGFPRIHTKSYQIIPNHTKSYQHIQKAKSFHHVSQNFITLKTASHLHPATASSISSSTRCDSGPVETLFISLRITSGTARIGLSWWKSRESLLC